MLFNSIEFLFLFLPAALIVYFMLAKLNNAIYQKLWLVAASLFFYAWWKPIYLVILVGSTLVNFILGRLVQSTNAKRAKSYLISGILLNVALLAYYKYANFIVDNVNYVSGSHFALDKIILPLAISFFTFQQIAYLVDLYRSKDKYYSLLDYSLFITFFPQLIAGPIVHHIEMMPQFSLLKNRRFISSNFAQGLLIFAVGLFKKMAIADTFACWANAGFDAQVTLSFFDAWAASLSYTFQLYYDFSGYTDMAIGAALMFNIRLPVNFNSPYKATNIQDFWRRWHMTLSRWLRDYVYIPLGGNRKGKVRTFINLFLTFLIGGIWHGAGWTFVIWGSLHGCALVIHRLWNQFGLRMNAILGWATTFIFVNFAWVFFRANSVDRAAEIVKGMLGMSGFRPNVSLFSQSSPNVWYLSQKTGSLMLVALMAGVALLTVLIKNSMEISGYYSERRYRVDGNYSLATTTGFSLAVGALLLLVSSGSTFLYFNF